MVTVSDYCYEVRANWIEGISDAALSRSFVSVNTFVPDWKAGTKKSHVLSVALNIMMNFLWSNSN